jgi:phenylpyruvate tautomerase PptA (4-oxalocrotonate tautomerase family)
LAATLDHRRSHRDAVSFFGWMSWACLILYNSKEKQMPLYTAIIEEDSLSEQTKTTIAQEITRIHTGVMRVPKNFVRVVFLSYPKGSGYTAGGKASTAALNCVLRSGHTAEDKVAMLQQLWAMFQSLTGIATDQLAISLQEIPSSNAMELGKIMQAVGHE